MVLALSALLLILGIAVMQAIALFPLYLWESLHLPTWVIVGVGLALFSWCMKD